MSELDVILRIGGASVLVTVALLLLLNAPRERVFQLFMPLALGLAGFLAVNTADPNLQFSGAPLVVASVLSGNATVFLWWFCLAVFDDDFRLGPVELGVGGVWFALFLLDRGVPVPALEGVGLSWALIALGFAMIGHLGWRIVRDTEGDLVEARRGARAVVVAGLVGLLVADFAVDLIMGFDWKPQGFTLGQNAVIVLIALGLAAWLLRANPEAMTVRPARAPTPEPEPPVAAAPETDSPPAEARLLRRLDALMAVDRIYLDPDLTFEMLVQRLGEPAPAVRRAIRRLGHGHFRSFLNSHRVAEARRALEDPARAGQKMTAIAFDAGFASLASFNRAFKLAEGRSPSEHRVLKGRF